MTSPTSRARTLAHSGASIAVAMAVMNATSYAFTMLAARILGPQTYGAFAAVLNVFLVASVVSLGLQATAARRISADLEHVGQIEHQIMRVTYRAALALGLVMLVLSPVVDRVLRLDNLPVAVLLALATVPLTVMGGQAGILQGERRWWPLSLLYAANGVPRLVVGVALIAWRPTELMATLVIAICALAPVLVGWIALRRPREPGALSAHHAARPIIRETLRGTQALLAFFALSNVDIVVARNVLDTHDAGLYAAGLILAKTVLFLPQFVVVVAFPAMSTAAERRRALSRSLSVAAGLGALAVAGSAALSGVAMIFVGGAEYSPIEPWLWLFAVLGTVLALLQLLVYSVLARQGQRSIYAVWLALVALVGLGLTADTFEQMLAVVVAVNVALFLVLFGLSLVVVRRPVPEAAVPPPEA